MLHCKFSGYGMEDYAQHTLCFNPGICGRYVFEEKMINGHVVGRICLRFPGPSETSSLEFFHKDVWGLRGREVVRFGVGCLMKVVATPSALLWMIWKYQEITSVNTFVAHVDIIDRQTIIDRDRFTYIYIYTYHVDI